MEIEEVKKLMGAKKLVINNCKFCNYACGFFYSKGKLYYDAGCNCVMYHDVHESEESELTWFINHNNIDENWIKGHLISFVYHRQHIVGD